MSIVQIELSRRIFYREASTQIISGRRKRKLANRRHKEEG